MSPAWRWPAEAACVRAARRGCPGPLCSVMLASMAAAPPTPTVTRRVRPGETFPADGVRSALGTGAFRQFMRATDRVQSRSGTDRAGPAPRPCGPGRPSYYRCGPAGLTGPHPTGTYGRSRTEPGPLDSLNQIKEVQLKQRDQEARFEPSQTDGP